MESRRSFEHVSDRRSWEHHRNSNRIPTCMFLKTSWEGRHFTLRLRSIRVDHFTLDATAEEHRDIYIYTHYIFIYTWYSPGIGLFLHIKPWRYSTKAPPGIESSQLCPENDRFEPERDFASPLALKLMSTMRLSTNLSRNASNDSVSQSSRGYCAFGQFYTDAPKTTP